MRAKLRLQMRIAVALGGTLMVLGGTIIVASRGGFDSWILRFFFAGCWAVLVAIWVYYSFLLWKQRNAQRH